MVEKMKSDLTLSIPIDFFLFCVQFQFVTADEKKYN